VGFQTSLANFIKGLSSDARHGLPVDGRKFESRIEM
jgi:hypothetical protein